MEGPLGPSAHGWLMCHGGGMARRRGRISEGRQVELGRLGFDRIIGHSLPRYLVVGVANTVVGLSAIFGIKYFTTAGDVLANLGGYVIGFAFSYAMNSRWTFGYRGPAASGIAKFALVTVSAYLCNLAVVLVALHWLGINSYLAQALGIPAYTAVGYLGARYFAFGDRAPRAA